MYNWSNEWQMLFNGSKCHCLHAGFNNPHYDYFIGDERIETTTLEKDLGVQMHPSLSVSEHVAYIVKKANRTLGSIRRTYTDKSKINILKLYQSMVRPHLEYCLQVWSPHLKRDIDKIEAVQRRATRMIASLRLLPYEERLKRCEMITLQRRRIRGDLIETFKIINGLTDIDPSLLFEIKEADVQSRTRGHNQKISYHHSRLDVRHNFFSQRVIKHWNNLPEKTVQSTSVNMFKSRIKFLFKV
jgi:hypothetical protein